MKEEALRLSEHSYRLLIEEAPYAICRATETGQLLQVNRAMMAMLGYAIGTEADLLMRDLPQIFVEPSDFERFRQSLLAIDTVQGLDSRWLCRDGRQIHVRIGGRRVCGADGETLCFDLLAENVTERRELEARLAQAEKAQAISQVARGIAHDFNNLLTVINGYCDLLLRDSGNAPRRDTLETIRQAGERAAGLAQQLLASSRNPIHRTEAIRLNPVVREVVTLSRRLMGENVLVTEELCAQGDSVRADAAQAHQMLMSLVIGARDSMPRGGELRIGTEVVEVGSERAARLDLVRGTYVMLTVAHSGEANVGGIELSPAYGMVRQSRGTIVTESAPGNGTALRIYLPQASGEAVKCDGGGRRIERVASTVLVVEDDEAVRRNVTGLLKSAGYEVLEAANGLDAMVIATHHPGPIHLLLTDMVMPGMDGRKLAQDVLGMHPQAKVLVVSGYSKWLSTAGPMDKRIRFLQKPFTAEHLAQTVKEAIGSAE